MEILTLKQSIIIILILLLLPIGNSDPSETTLKEVNASEILVKIENGVPVEYNHVNILGNLIINSLDLPMKYDKETSESNAVKVISSPIRIENSTFNGYVDFSNTILDNQIDLSGSNFLCYVDFRNVNFSSKNILIEKNSSSKNVLSGKNSNFIILDDLSKLASALSGLKRSEYTLGKVISFSESEIEFEYGSVSGYDFRGSADFSGATFSSVAHFEKATFCGVASFRGATFNSAPRFSLAEFRDLVDFGGATFGDVRPIYYGYDDPLIDSFRTSALLMEDSLKYKHPEFTQFGGAHFGGYTNFNGAKFISGIDFLLASFRENISFSKTTFSDDISFSGDFAGDADFSGARFMKSINFNKAIFHKNIDFNESYLGGDADFSGAKFSKNIYFNSVNFSGYLLGWKNIFQNMNLDEAGYLRLIKNFKDHGQFEDADDCYYHYRYDKMLSNSLSDIPEFFWDALSLITCGYGVKWTYTVIFALAIAVLFSLWYSLYVNWDLYKALVISAFVIFSLPSDWNGSDEVSKFLSKHKLSATIERLIGWGLLIILINTLNRIMIRY